MNTSWQCTVHQGNIQKGFGGFGVNTVISDCSHDEPFINLVAAITYSVGPDNTTTHIINMYSPAILLTYSQQRTDTRYTAVRKQLHLKHRNTSNFC